MASKTICLLDNHTLLGGAQRFLVDLAKGLVAHQWQVHVILGGEGPLQRALEASGIPVLIERLPGWARYDAAPRLSHMGGVTVLRLTQHLRRMGASLVIANSPSTALLGGLAARLSRGRVIWRIHHSAEVLSAVMLSQICCHLVDYLFASTQAGVAAVHTIFGEDKRLCLVRHGITVGTTPAPEFPRLKRGDSPVVGMLGSWRPGDGQEVLVKAFRILHNTGRNAHLILAGESHTPAEERYRAMIGGAIKAAGLSERVTIVEHMQDSATLLSGCHVVAIPSLTQSTGRIALEAAALGRPVIASRVEGLTDIIEDGHTGLLAPPGNPRALADALTLLVASPALRVEMGRQARRHAEEHFSLAAVLDAIESVPPGQWWRYTPEALLPGNPIAPDAPSRPRRAI